MTMQRTLVAAVAWMLFPITAADAQCPDGSPAVNGVCRTATVATATRRVNPPLDDRTWIVVPFDNLRKTAEADWLRNASVNLLYLDMSRWKDIKVVDDERVSDLLREASPTSATPTLNAAIDMAKRAGAGKLVMGDVLAAGNRTAITAKIFDVKTGQRVRSVQETAPDDSVMPLFGKLAQKILNVAPPPGTRLSAAGTTRIDAYQEYLLGVGALNRFDVVVARTHLDRAIQLDSTFALAHYKLSIARGWGEAGPQDLRSPAEAAERLGTGLPARERGLIKGQLTHARGDEAGACAAYSELLRADSSDVEAWYGLGECSYHDNTVDVIGGDSTKLQFHGSWNASLRAFERVLALDPTYHIAFQHMVDMWTNGARSSCLINAATRRCMVPVSTYVRWSGDSLLYTPMRTLLDTAALRLQREERYRSDARRRQLLRADGVTQRWVFAGPQEPRAHLARANVLNYLGRLPEARTELAQYRANFTEEAVALALFRMELATKLGEGREVIRLYDSVRASPETRRAPTAIPGAPPNATRFPLATGFAQWSPVLGRMAEFDTAFLRPLGPQPLVLRYQPAFTRAAIGAGWDSTGVIEAALFEEARRSGMLEQMQRSGVRNFFAPSMVYGLTLPRTSWAGLDTLPTTDLKTQMIVAYSRRDTASLRRVAVRMDSLARVLTNGLVSDSGLSLSAAESFLILRDSAAAQRSVRFMLDSAITPIGLATSFPSGVPYWTLVPRASLLRADLAAARGQRDEAREWYRRFLDLWSTADAEFRPLVDRARKGYTAAGGAP